MSTALLTSFLTQKRAVGLSPRSIEWYEMCLGNYLAYCQEKKYQYEKPDTLTAFLAHLHSRKYATATVSGYFTALSTWFNWLVRRKHLDESPMRYIDRPRKQRKRKRHIKQHEFVRLYRSINGETWNDYRDKAILLVMFYSGLRLGEVLHLTPADIDEVGRLVSVIDGKGGNDRVVPCHPQLIADTLQYLYLRPPYQDRHLFVANDGHGRIRGPLSDDGLRSMLARRFREAGLPYYNPHAFRHGFAMLFLNSGMELSAVSDVLGHSNTRVTEDEYAHWVTTGLTRTYNNTLRNQGDTL